MPTLGLAPVPCHPTPPFWAGGPRGPSSKDEVMRWLRLVQSTFVPKPSGGGGEEAGARSWDRGSRRPAPPRLRGSEHQPGPLFTSYRSECGDSGSIGLASLSMAALRRWGRGLGDWEWQKAFALWSWITQRTVSAASIPGTCALPIPSSSEATASPGGQTWNRRRGDLAFPEMTHCEMRSQGLLFIATEQR